MESLILLLVIIGVGMLVLAWSAPIPTNYVGVETIFGNRFFFGRAKIRVLPEGLGWRTFPRPISTILRIPLLQELDEEVSVEAYTAYAEVTEPGKESPAGELALVTWELAFKWRASRYPSRLRRFVELSTDALMEGKDVKTFTINAAIVDLKNLLLSLTSQVGPAHVLDCIEEFGLILNLFSRGKVKDEELENWLDYFRKTPTDREELRKDLRKKVGEIDKQDRLEGKWTQADFARAETEEETGQRELHISPIEDGVGISIEKVSIKKRKFDKKTDDAFHAKVRQSRKAQGAAATVDAMKKLAEQLPAGLTPAERARYAAMALELPVSTIAIDTREGGSPPFVIVQTPTSQPSQQPPTKAKKGRSGKVGEEEN
ncbi:hypothetical protein C4553_02510 [Candidatus Parcubacteria bacterium]|nr:MAG: hypothetical protein C4553_02510 [Candidatus Parcubacteria bacterium]